MTRDSYEDLAEALNRLPNGFPRTPSNVETKILRRIFTNEEAALASQLQRDMSQSPRLRAGLSYQKNR